VARNRKRAKERRARRPEPVGGGGTAREEPPVPIGHAAPDVELAEAQLAVGRPAPVEDGDGELLDDDFGDVGAADEEEAEVAAEAHAAALPAPREHRPSTVARVVNFAQGSWRELQRVQWPDRRQVMQATGVVIGFVIIAGAFLGLSDLVSQKLMNFILK